MSTTMLVNNESSFTCDVGNTYFPVNVQLIVYNNIETTISSDFAHLLFYRHFSSRISEFSAGTPTGQSFQTGLMYRHRRPKIDLDYQSETARRLQFGFNKTALPICTFTLTIVLNTETMISSQFNLSSETTLDFQFGYGDNITELGRSPGTTSATDAGFPGLMRGTVTNTRCFSSVLGVDPVLKYNMSSDVPKTNRESENVRM